MEGLFFWRETTLTQVLTKGGHAYRFYKWRFNFARKICQIFINGASVILRGFFHISGSISGAFSALLGHNCAPGQPEEKGHTAWHLPARAFSANFKGRKVGISAIDPSFNH